MDHGVPWVEHVERPRADATDSVALKHGIRLYFSGVGHPQTQGKVERLHRTMQQAIERDGGNFPAGNCGRSRFSGNTTNADPIRHCTWTCQPVDTGRAREFIAKNPPRWEYDTGTDVRRLNSQGCVRYGKQRYFVCGALADEDVVIESLQDRILVRYRQTYVREIDIRSGKTRPLVLSPPNMIMLQIS